MFKTMKPHLKTYLFLAFSSVFALASFWCFHRNLIESETDPASQPVPPAQQTTKVIQDLPSTSFQNNASATDQTTETSSLPNLDDLRKWARNNTAAALTWVHHAPAGSERDAVLEVIAPYLAQSNPAQAVALTDRLSSQGSNLLENLVMQWAAQDEQAALAYANSRPAGDGRNRLFGRIAFIQSQQNPAEAAQLVAEKISPGTVQDEAAISVVHQWAWSDPNAAMVWAEQLPDDLRKRAINEVKNLTALSAHQ